MINLLQLYRDNPTRAQQPLNVVRNDADASLYIYDVIDPDWGVSAMGVIDAVTRAGNADVLHVYINSPGGSVFEGRAIMAALSRFTGKTIAHIDSLCASAATSIALSCDEVQMSDGALFMIHNASGLVWGDKSDMRSTADLLEKIETSIIADYTAKTGKSTEAITAWMDAETWFTAAEALANGFIDEVTPAPAKPSNSATWNLAAFQKAPVALAPRLSAPTIDTPAVADPVVTDPVVADTPPVEPPVNPVEPPAPPASSMTTANANRLALIQAV